MTVYIDNRFYCFVKCCVEFGIYYPAQELFIALTIRLIWLRLKTFRYVISEVLPCDCCMNLRTAI